MTRAMIPVVGTLQYRCILNKGQLLTRVPSYPHQLSEWQQQADVFVIYIKSLSRTLLASSNLLR